MALKFNTRTRTPASNSFAEKMRGKTDAITVDEPAQTHRQAKIAKSGGVAGIWAADKSGCSWWRLEMPRLALHYGNRADIQMMCGVQSDVETLANFDTYVVQRHMLGIHLEHMDLLKKISDLAGSSLIFDIDDICVGEDIPEYNAMRDGYQTPELESQFKEAVHKCDEMHVCSQYMADYYRNRLDFQNITVVPNMPMKMWYGNHYDPDLISKNYYKNRKRPRVGWVGSATHLDVMNKTHKKDDFGHVEDIIIKTINRFKWVFFGAAPAILDPYIKIGQIEVYPWVPLFDYPAFFKGLNLQAVVAPLADNHFNRAKSNIKWVESGLLGINGAFQDMEPYAEAKYRFNTGSEMIDQIDDIIRDDGRYLRESATVRKRTEEYLVDRPENVDLLYSSLFNPYGSTVRRQASPKLVGLNRYQFR